MLLTSVLAAPAWARGRVRLDQRGEGVVSAAMAARRLPYPPCPPRPWSIAA